MQAKTLWPVFLFFSRRIKGQFDHNMAVLPHNMPFFVIQIGHVSRTLATHVQFSLFLQPDEAQNTLSGIQGREVTAVAII